MEAGEYGLTSGACLVARRLEVVALVGLLWIRGVFWVRRDFSCFFFVFFLRTHTTCCKYSYEAAYCLSYLSTSNEARTRERSDLGRFLSLGQKSLFIPGCV